MFSTQQAGEPVWESLKDQVDRLAGLDGFPKSFFEPAAYRELVVALQNAETLEDAKNFVDDVMMCEIVCPKPVQLRDMIRAAREAKVGSAVFEDIDAWKRLQEIPSDVTPSEKQNLSAHMQILLARMAQTKTMTWPQRQQPRPLKQALEIAGRQLLKGEKVTGTY
jgi:hypothetical protein